MNEFNITIEGGTSKRLPVGNKWSDNDIIVTATGGKEDLEAVLTEQEALIDELKEALQGKAGGVGGTTPAVIEPLSVTENGTYTAPDGVDGYSPVTVSVENLLDKYLSGTLTSLDTNLTTLTDYACYTSKSITSVNLPEATKIGTSCFRGCSNLASFNAPKITSLGTYAFYGCSKLTYISFQNVSQAPSTCFYQCTGLLKADFGVNCKTLAGSSLAYCSKLTHLILRYTAGVVSIATNAFSGANFDGYVYVPKTLADGSDGVESYKVYTNWSNLSVTFRAIEDYPEITGG